MTKKFEISPHILTKIMELGLYDTRIAEGVALKRNIEALKKTLDTRKNYMGMVDGREMLAALQHNKSLVKKVISLDENISGLTRVNSQLRSTHLKEIKSLEERMSDERKQWEMEKAAKDSLILTLRIEKETQHNQMELLKINGDNRIADEQKYQRGKERINEAQVKSLTDKIMKYLQDKEDMAEEIRKMKCSIRKNKLMFDEELANQRAKFKEEDALKSKQYEERIDTLLASKEELQSKISKLMVQETETHAKLYVYQKDVENYKEAILQNQFHASLSDQEHRNEINKLRNEIDQEKRKCRNLNGKLDDAAKKCADMQCEMNHLRNVKTKLKEFVTKTVPVC